MRCHDLTVYVGHSMVVRSTSQFGRLCLVGETNSMLPISLSAGLGGGAVAKFNPSLKGGLVNTKLVMDLSMGNRYAAVAQYARNHHD